MGSKHTFRAYAWRQKMPLHRLLGRKTRKQGHCMCVPFEQIRAISKWTIFIGKIRLRLEHPHPTRQPSTCGREIAAIKGSIDEHFFACMLRHFQCVAVSTLVLTDDRRAYASPWSDHWRDRQAHGPGQGPASAAVAAAATKTLPRARWERSRQVIGIIIVQGGSG